MRKILKYPVTSDDCLVLMPDRATILKVGVQGIDINLWALVDDSEPPVRRRFLSVNTGTPVQDQVTKQWYLDTVTVDDIVWHIFELPTRYRYAE